MPTASSADTTLAVLVHLSIFAFGLIGPLAVYLIKKDASPFTRHHAAEALTHITLAIAAAVSFVLLFAVAIGGAVFGVLAAVAAGRGEYYRYPLTIRFVS